ncbi:hypothetical protein [Paenibacillus lactis]|uniref:hypothetical protein n=1 Tax=Paenibacillus lactis TaxID=228574 RepID=UPI000683DE8F
MKKILSMNCLLLSLLLLLAAFFPTGGSVVSAESLTSEESINLYNIEVNDNTDSSEDISIQNDSELIEPFAEIGPTYPGTNVPMRIGDVLYSTKTLGSSSQIVGHTGIVNSNYKVVHVTLPVNGGTVDNMSGYMSRHGKGETIKVYRPINGMGVEAAKWATYNYKYVTKYEIEPYAKKSTLSPNYCSKFVWQAFYYGEGIDLLDLGNTPDLRGFITPSMVINAPNLVYVTQFTAQ